jgi:D-lactate dehydrogenase (cytochrome)
MDDHPQIEHSEQPSRLVDELGAALKRRFGHRFTTSRPIRNQHTETLGAAKLVAPEGVLFVQSDRDVVDAVKLCAEHRCPVIPYGAGTSIGGHVSAVEGGVTLNFTQMGKVLEINTADFDCKVQPGVTREQLNTELRHHGLFFPVDPGANASLGGMAGTGASGTTTVRYGAMRQNVMGLQVVLADGTLIRTGGRSKKSSAGYDLTKLFIGSEGTLGVTTELTLRLHPIPESISAASCAFPSSAAAASAATEIMQSGLAVARMEFIDSDAVSALNSHGGFAMAQADYLFLEFHGTPDSVARDIATAGEIVAPHGGAILGQATRPEDVNRLWTARRRAGMSALAKYTNSKMQTTDVCVPISMLSQCIEETKSEVAALGLNSIVVGHVGDGNFHLGIILPNTGEHDGHAVTIYDSLVRRALAMEGTCSGEHGIGLVKQRYLAWEHGAALDTMRLIKRALDPQNILNPGKVFQLSAGQCL